MEDLEIKNINSETVKYYKECFDLNGSFKKAENIEWQFLLNPIKKQFVNIGIDPIKNKTAAIYAIAPVVFKIGGDEILGSQSLDTITDIDYRGRGLFIDLAKNIYKKAADEGVALVYGFPNGNSIYGFKKKLEWEVLDPLPFLIKPLNSKYFTKKIKALRFLPNISLSLAKASKNGKFYLKEENSFTEEVNSIWKQFSKEIKVAVSRTKEYLDWRYIQKPNEDYKIVHCYSSENEKYLGFIIYTVKEKHNGKIGYIMELIYDLKTPESARFLLNYAVSYIKQQNADCILAWCLEHSPNKSVYKNSFFIDLPEKFRPIELHFGARSFRDDLKDLINKRENWYISYSDSDTV